MSRAEHGESMRSNYLTWLSSHSLTQIGLCTSMKKIGGLMKWQIDELHLQVKEVTPIFKDKSGLTK